MATFSVIATDERGRGRRERGRDEKTSYDDRDSHVDSMSGLFTRQTECSVH